MRKMYSKKQVEDIVLESLENADKVAIGGDLEVSGDIKYLENIVDSAGNKRFIEGDIEDLEASFTPSYAKWSLSGTHLTIVVAGTFPSGKEFTSGVSFKLVDVGLPSWIGSKIYAVDGVVDVKLRPLNDSNNIYRKQTDLNCYFDKTSNTVFPIWLVPTETHTLSETSYIRMSFDLLIDME